jgi:hypothetical protein
MSLEFIAHRERVETTSYAHHFEWANEPGAGFSFDCNAAGYLNAMPEAALANYDKCIDCTYDVIDCGVRAYTVSYWQPAVVKCECGRRIYLDDAMTNECERCGLLCNGSGQVLAPMSQWDAEAIYERFGPRNDRNDY